MDPILLPIPHFFTDLSLLAMRIVVAIVFASSGWNDLKDPKNRAKSIGMSVPFTIFLGTAEVAGGLGLTLGILTPYAALGLILIGLGAIGKKIFQWKSGFWGTKSYGWHYDLLLLVMNLVILTTGGGGFVIF